LVQLTSKEESTKIVAAKLLNELRNIFTEAIRRAQIKGLISNKSTPELLGLYLCNFWNGFNVTRRMEPTTEILIELIELNFKILE